MGENIKNMRRICHMSVVIFFMITVVVWTNSCNNAGNAVDEAALNEKNTHDMEGVQEADAPEEDDVVSENEYIKTGNKDCVYVECMGDNDTDYDLVSWYRRDEMYYLFLPSMVDMDRVIIRHTFDNDVYLDGELIENGSVIPISEGEHEVRAGDDSFNMFVMHSENVPAMFINADKDVSYLNSDIQNVVSGNVSLIDENGRTEEIRLEKMKGRGNTSWRAGELFGKYPYNIKLDKKTDVFGIAENKKWCLIAQVFDESLIRNIMMNELSRSIGLEVTPGAKNTDVYYNEEYIGTYLVSQKVDIGENSLIKINDMDKSDDDDISGGYLIECELGERFYDEEYGFISNRHQYMVIKAPSEVNNEQKNYIKDYFQRVEDAVYSKDGYNEKGEYYADLIDEESFAKVYLLNEFSMNIDAGATSFFMYKDKDSVLKAGPIWDFDWALGSYEYKDGINLVDADGWFVRKKRINDGTQRSLMAMLCSHDDFWEIVVRVWQEELHDNIRSLIEGQCMIDVMADTYRNTAAMNFTRYDILTLCPQWGSADTGDTYDENIAYLKENVRRRLEFMENNIK